MGQEASATVKLVARDKAFRTAMTRVQRVMQRVRETMQRVAAAARRTLLVGGAALAGFLKLAGDQEKAERLLDTALEASGQSAERFGQQLRDMASELQAVTTTGDETILELATLATMMGINADQMKGFITQAIGLTKAGLDAKLAIRGLALAHQGDFNALNRYIPALRTANTATEKLAALNKFAASGFKQITEEARVFSGRVIQLKNILGDVGETIGALFIPRILKMIEGVKALMPQLQLWIERNAALIKGATALTLGVASLTIAVSALGGAIALTTIGVKGLAAAFAVITAHPIVAIFTAVAATGLILFKVVTDNRSAMDKLTQGTDAYTAAAGRQTAAEKAAAEALRVSNERRSTAVKRIDDQRKALEKQIASVRSGLGKRILTFGLGGAAADIALLKAGGATEEDLRTIRKQEALLAVMEAGAKAEDQRTKAAEDALKAETQRAKALKSEADNIRDLVKSDAQRTAEAKTRLSELVKIGAITRATAAARAAQLAGAGVTAGESLAGRLESADALIRRITQAAGATGGGTPAQQTAQSTATVAQQTAKTATATQSTARDTATANVTLRDILDVIREAISQLPLVGAFG